MAERIKSKKYLLGNRYEHFYILDFGHYSIKLALFEIDKQNNTGKFIDFSEAVHSKHVVSEGSADFENILATSRKAFSRIKPNRREKKKHLVVGVASEIAYGHSFTYVHKREHPKKKIDPVEVKNAIHNAEQRAYEDIRKKFSAESGYSETEVSLINSAIQSIKVDGYEVSNPEGKNGEELQLSIFNAYLPAFYKKIFDDLAEYLKIPMFSIVYEPFSVFESLKKRKKEALEALIIDVGGRTTRVSLARKGRLEDVKTFSFGGESLTHRIAAHLKVGFWEAEGIKGRYASNRLGESALSVVAGILQTELEIFLRALSMILKEFSHTTLLPSTIYLYGAGGSVPLFDSIMQKRKWKEDLSFLTQPKIYRLKLDMFENIETKNKIPPASKWFSVFSMADFVLDSINNHETSASKTLNRMAKLIEK